MDGSERRAAGAGAATLALVAMAAMVWPDLAMASLRSAPVPVRPWVDAAMCFAPLLWAPLPAALGLWAASSQER